MFEHDIIEDDEIIEGAEETENNDEDYIHVDPLPRQPIEPSEIDDETDYSGEETPDADEEEENTETIDEDVEYVNYPDFIEEDYVIPEKFKSPNEELNWYKEKYESLIIDLAGEKFASHISEKYKDHLIEKEQEVDKLKSIKYLLEGEPELAMKLFAPRYLINAGHDVALTDKEMNKLLVEQLQKNFGENYVEYYNEEDAQKKGTLSNRMIEFQEDLRQKMIDRTNAVKAEYQPITPEMRAQKELEAYREYFEPNGITKEEFVEFLEESKSIQMDIQKLHYLTYFDDYIEDAYQRGFEEGRQKVTNNIKKAGSRLTVEREPQPKPRNNGKPRIYNFYDVLDTMKKG